MGNFLAELKRRQVYRVGAAYAVIAWLLLQLFNNVAPILESPPWVGRVLLLLLVVGFPLALLLAWTFEATLAGIKRETPAPAGAAGALRHAWIDWVLAGALVVVIGLVSYEQLAPRDSQPQVQTTGMSIAVLPFTNLSGDASQDFFSDGMTEEITSALARVQGLTVLARTSAFEFKGQNRNVRAIGEALNARYLIEGSVRKDGDRLRITAQLVQAESGANVWTENYDRQLTNIFAIQEDIARAIAEALRVPLGLRQGESLVASRTDLDSYQQYLRARALYRARRIDDAIAILEPLIARDPNFAPGFGLLAQAYSLAPNYVPFAIAQSRRASVLEKQEMVAREAIRLDPRLAGGYVALASIPLSRGSWAEGDDMYRQAFTLDPNDPDALQLYGLRLATTGHLKQALESRERLRTLEPFVPVYNIITAQIMQLNGQSQASIPILEAIPADPATDQLRNSHLAAAFAAAGRYADAADTLLAIRSNRFSRQSLEDAARLLRSAPAKVAADALPVLEGAVLQFVYAHVGAHERILENAERNLETFGLGFNPVFWDPLLSPLRKTERFKALVRTSGLADYWRERGWPDLCRPIGADDFVCD